MVNPKAHGTVGDMGWLLLSVFSLCRGKCTMVKKRVSDKLLVRKGVSMEKSLCDVNSFFYIVINVFKE